MTRYLLIGCGVLALLTGLQSWRLERVKTELHDAKQQIASLEAFKQAAKDDAQIYADQCAARVAEARRSAQRIETIIEREVPRDPNGCPYRTRIDGRELRKALQPDAPAEPLH